MSDADRALAATKARIARAAAAAPEHVDDEDSLPIITDAGDGAPTPVESHRGERRRRKRQSVQEFAEDIKTEVRELRKAVDESIRAELNNRAELAERLVKVETHLEFLKELDGEAAADELLRLRADLTSLRVTLIGEDGKNGKISQLTEAASKGPRFVKRTIAAAIGMALGSIIPAAIYVKHIVEDSASERATVLVELESAKAERTVLQAQVLLLFRLTGSRGQSGVFDPTSPGVSLP